MSGNGPKRPPEQAKPIKPKPSEKLTNAKPKPKPTDKRNG